MGVSMIGRSAAARRREYRKQHEIFSSDDSVKYHEDKALEMLAGWFLEQSKTLPLAKWEEWSVFDYHPPGQLRCIANWDRYRLGPDRRPILSEVERLFVGRRDGITRVTFVGRYSGGNDVLIPEVVQGGTYDGVIVDQTVDGYRRYGVLLDRPINEEEEFRLRWQFRYDHEKSIADPLPVIANVFEIQPCLSRIDVIFDPRAIPMRVYSAVAPSGSWPRRGDEPVQMKLEKDHTGSALWRTVPKEYAAGIYWEWD
jgi:hypothetical protein